MNSQMKKCIGQSPEWSQLQELLPHGVWGLSPAQHVDVSTTQQLSELLWFGFSWRLRYTDVVDYIIGKGRLTQTPALLSPLRLGVWG